MGCRGWGFFFQFFFLVWVLLQLTANCRWLYKTCNIFFCNTEVLGVFILSAVEQSFFYSVNRQQRRQSLSLPSSLPTFGPSSFISPSFSLPRPAVGLTFIDAPFPPLGRHDTGGSEESTFVFRRLKTSFLFPLFSKKFLLIETDSLNTRWDLIEMKGNWCQTWRVTSVPQTQPTCSFFTLRAWVVPPPPLRTFLFCVTEISSGKILWPVKEKSYFLSLWLEPLMHYHETSPHRWRENSLSSVWCSNTEDFIHFLFKPFSKFTQVSCCQ